MKPVAFYLLLLLRLHAQTLIQSANAPSTSAITTQSVSFTALPVIGHTVVVGVIQGANNNAASVFDNQVTPNAYSLLQAGPPGQAALQASIWCAPVLTSSGTFTISATMLNTFTFITVFAAEYSGLSCNLDTSNKGTGTSTSPYTCGALVTRNAKDLLVTLIDSDAAAVNTFTVNSSFAIEQQVNSGILFQPGAYADRVVSSTGSFNPIWTVSTNANASCVNAALMAATSGSGGQKGFPIVQ